MLNANCVACGEYHSGRDATPLVVQGTVCRGEAVANGEERKSWRGGLPDGGEVGAMQEEICARIGGKQGSDGCIDSVERDW